jgi:hypothetical protein
MKQGKQRMPEANEAENYTEILIVHYHMLFCSASEGANPVLDLNQS